VVYATGFFVLILNRMVLPLEKMRWDSGVMSTIRSTSSALPEPARTLGSLGWRGKMRSANDRAVPTRCALVLFQGGPRMFELHADDIVDIREYFKELKDPARRSIKNTYLEI
jgi:hypothetical protein